MTLKGQISENRHLPSGPPQTDISRCPICNQKLQVVDSRSRQVGTLTTVVRRRECTVHPGRHVSVEIPEDIAREVLFDD